MIKVTKRNYEATRAGWLLACDHPGNIAKGEDLYALLNDKNRDIALAYRDQCIAVYATAK